MKKILKISAMVLALCGMSLGVFSFTNSTETDTGADCVEAVETAEVANLLSYPSNPFVGTVVNNSGNCIEIQPCNPAWGTVFLDLNGLARPSVGQKYQFGHVPGGSCTGGHKMNFVGPSMCAF